ncbi:class I SAM-dependent methyltransferase [Patescibacteria group bacterium]|nr:class I SAM-dependent methyltransferase [Patescibacteria group bacterium]
MDLIDYQKINSNTSNHFWYKARTIAINNFLKQKLKTYSSNRQILEIGCGTGINIATLNKYGIVTGLDINKDSIQIAKELGCKRIIQADVEKYKLEPNSFDTICAFDCLEHIKNDHAALENIYQALKPNGYLFLSAPSYPLLFSSHDIAMMHQRRYSKNDILSKFNKVNFVNTEFYYWNSILLPAIGTVRLIKRLLFMFLRKVDHKSEAVSHSPILNKLLFTILNIENKIIQKKIYLPFGLSTFIIAQKNETKN